MKTSGNTQIYPIYTILQEEHKIGLKVNKKKYLASLTVFIINKIKYTI